MLAESRGMLNLLIKAICFVLSDLLHPKLHEVMSFIDRKSTRLNSSHGHISYAVFCLKKKTCIFVGRHALLLLLCFVRRKRPALPCRPFHPPYTTTPSGWRRPPPWPASLPACACSRCT